MKRILLACFLLTATCTILTIQPTTVLAAPVITQASFQVKVNALDAFIAAGNMTAAQAKWDDIHEDMIAVLAVTKASIAGSTTPADVTHYTNIMTNQRDLYAPVWQMHTDLVTNRTAINTKLTAFANTIY
jgi:hypothetical protein